MEKSRKRLYRRKVKCSKCGKELDGDYKTEHLKRVHEYDQQVEFHPVVDPKQRKLSFGVATSTKLSEAMPTEATTSTEDVSITTGDDNNEEIQDQVPAEPDIEVLVTKAKNTGAPPATDSEEGPEEKLVVAETLAETDIQTGPNQPLLDTYNRKQLGQESGTRDFNPNLFKKYPWTSFDTATKSIICFPCEKFLFDYSFTFSNWKKPERLAKHASSRNHSMAMSKWIQSKVNHNRESSVLAQLDTAHRDMVEKNRAYLKVIIESILYTAQQNIPQRGHTEDRSNIGKQSDVNRGNLIELLHLRCKDIPWLAAKLNSQLEAHQQWLSPEIQNEILNITSDLVLNHISQVVKEAGRFSLIADETSDVSNKEQIAICLRYIYKAQPTETFIGFYEAQSTTGEALFNMILEVLKSMKLRIEDAVGQCYDGASNMTGKEKGVAARVQEVAPKALYVHCYGHLLNLALQDTLQENAVIRNALGVVQSIHHFFNSPKREHVLRSVQIPADFNSVPFIKLKSISETRWACRWEAVKAIEQQPERILLALIQLSKDKDAKTSVDATGLVKAMLEFQFVLGLHILKVIFSNTNSLASYLQGHEVDVMAAKATCEATIKTLSKCREEEMFSLIWEKAQKTAKNISEIAPNKEVQTSKRQKKPSIRLQALLGETPEVQPILFTDIQRGRIEVYYDALDRVLSEMKERFAGRDTNILTSLADIVVGKATEESFKAVSDFYSIDADVLMGETAIFHNLESVNLKTASQVVNYLYSNSLDETLPHFTEVVTTLAAIPATSCSAERSFSCLRRLKTYLRSTMGQERLSALGLLCIERSHVNQVDINTIIDIFGRRKGRDSMFF